MNQSALPAFKTNDAFKHLGLTTQPYQGGMFGNSTPNIGDYMDKGSSGGGLLDVFGDMNMGKGLDMLGTGMGLFGDYMKYKNQKKMMKAGITNMNNQTKVGNYNMANQTNFKNATIDVFGSGQAHNQNQFGKMV